MVQGGAAAAPQTQHQTSISRCRRYSDPGAITASNHDGDGLVMNRLLLLLLHSPQALFWRGLVLTMWGMQLWTPGLCLFLSVCSIAQLARAGRDVLSISCRGQMAIRIGAVTLILGICPNPGLVTPLIRAAGVCRWPHIELHTKVMDGWVDG